MIVCEATFISMIPKYDGTSVPVVYCATFEEAMGQSRPCRTSVGRAFRLVLERRALEWYENFSEAHGYSGEPMKNSFTRRFRSARNFISRGPEKKGRYVFE